ncbi:response regulator [Hypericibacter terrae]|uniref:response regulator n=1 Tax=Hypericibacter terrae TaxID=2602015 RepID=UPI00177EFD4E|nr:response regulator [Hypericibacter terrae]
MLIQNLTNLPIPNRPARSWTAARDEPGTDDDPSVLRFRHYCVLPRARQLLADGRSLEIGSRAFDLLVVLLESRGTLVTKNEIVKRVWPSTLVEDSNLRVQMTALRKVLGRDGDLIKTVPGRGYMLAAETTAEPPASLFCEPPVRAPATVAVIDDDRDVREALHSLLRSAGMRVELFGSVPEFLDSPHPNLPDCVVLDVMLPGKSGLDFHEDLVRAKRQLPVIFISGQADVPMSVRAMKGGAVEFLTKPVRHQDLLRAVLQAIAPVSA